MSRERMSTLIVRPGIQTDGAFVRALSRDAFARFAIDPTGAMVRMLRAPTAHSFVAELDHEPVAVAVSSFATVHAGTVAHLDAIAVVASARGRGIGRRLLEHVEQHARAHGSTSLSLMTAVHNMVARSLFESAGFMHLATQSGVYRRGQRAVLLLKPLL